jgi:hypothetical protein
LRPQIRGVNHEHRQRYQECGPGRWSDVAMHGPSLPCARCFPSAVPNRLTKTSHERSRPPIGCARPLGGRSA